MINAMGAIGILGFIVWALNKHLKGPFLHKQKKTHFVNMLELLNKTKWIILNLLSTIKKFHFLKNQQETLSIIQKCPVVKKGSSETRRQITQNIIPKNKF